jgi:hypothetical protein
LHRGDVSEHWLQKDYEIRQWLVEQHVFEGSPLEKCVLPFESRLNGRSLPYVTRRFLITHDGEAAPVNFAQLFPCASDVTHFDGSEEQLTSFAALYGKLQNALSTMPEQLIHSRNKDNLAPYDFDDLAEKFKAVSGVSKLPRARKNKLIEWFIAKELLINEWLEEGGNFWSSHEPKMRLLHDVHPHNAFFNGQDCALIYDYQWLDDWQHGHVLAYTAHRFVRECVRVSYEGGDPDYLKRIPALLNAFIESYASGGPAIPADFRETLHLRIAGSALCKVYSVMSTAVSSDWLGRSLDCRLDELRKFESFLKEAEHFAPH